METVADMHNEGIASFMRLQGRFHQLETIWDIYSGLQALNFAYNVRYHEANVTEFHAVAGGQYLGNFTSPRFGVFSSVKLDPFSMTYRYTVKLPRLTYYYALINLVIDLEYNSNICQDKQEMRFENSWKGEEEIVCQNNDHTVLEDQQKCNGSYPIECFDERCSFSLLIDCDIGNQGIDNRSGFKMSWYFTISFFIRF